MTFIKKSFLSSEDIKNTCSIILSLLVLVFPVVFWLYLNITFSFSFGVVFLVSFLLHLSLLPLLFIINDRNAWSYDFSNPMYTSWLHPRIIKQVSLALIYPYLFGVYYSFIRFNRLGSTINIDFSILGDYEYAIITSMILFPFFYIIFSPQIEKISSFIKEKRDIPWNSTAGLFYSWYIHKLSKDKFFFVIEKIYKCYRFLFGYCSVNNPIYWHSTEEIAWYKYVFNFFYWNISSIAYIITFGGIVFEILWKKEIHYGLYILFLIPFIRILYTFWGKIGSSLLYVPACLADYLYTDWKNLKFPSKFASCVGLSDIIYPVTLYPTENQKIILEEISNKYRPMYLPYRPKTEMFVHQRQLIERVKGRPWGMRFAADYLHLQGKRFFHSSSSLKMPGGANIPPKPPIIPNKEYLHPATAAFCRSPMQRVSMYNKDRISYEAIQAVEKRMGGLPLHKDTFQSSLLPPKPNETRFVTHSEVAACSYFHHAELKFGISASRYYKNVPVSYTDTEQMQPDVILDTRDANIVDKRVHPYDAKTGWGVERSNNIVVSNRSKMQYQDLLYIHRENMGMITNITLEQEKTLVALQAKYGNVNGQQDVLMPNMHLFSNHSLPPLHNPENFYTGWFSPKAYADYAKANDTVTFVDDYLVSNNIPKPRTKMEWQQFFEKNYPDVKSNLDRSFTNNPFYNKNWSTSDDYLSS